MTKQLRLTFKKYCPISATKEYTKRQNLGQTYGKSSETKYFSKSEDGQPTGVGYAFEDLTRRRWEEAGLKVQQVAPAKNGADFTVNGESCQLKCGKNGGATGRSFYKEGYGEYKYSGQTAVIPKGQEKAEKVFQMRDKNGLGRPIKVVESPATREESIDYGTKGIKSFAMDATDLNLIRPAVAMGALAVLGCVVINCIKIHKHKKELGAKVCAKETLKMVAIGVGVAGLTLVGECMYRQNFRPRSLETVK